MIMSENKSVMKRGNGSNAPEALLPPVDVIEDAAGITMIADLPGVPKDKLNLQLGTDSLTMEGEVALDIAGYGIEPCRSAGAALSAHVYAFQRSGRRENRS
jgi:HSP20 family molecular chaperone IbpA